MLAMMMALAIAAQAAPGAEAERLGTALARSGTLATLLPMIEAKDTEEMVAAHPELTDAEKTELRATARQIAAAGIDRIMADMGRAYAAALSEADLKALVAFNQTAAAIKYREVGPQVIGATMASVGQMDFKAETIAAFCRKTGQACPKP